ncbi:MAG: NAD-dependent epimerase/dehydratase family protein [Planctomycetes bacterium]|nr:NAD-dependent epimerase/dehydratase family protein [Planctomycetota bacterium]
MAHPPPAADRPWCFVTGATGFVGRHLLPRLAEQYRLRCLVRTPKPAPQLARVPFAAVPGDLGDAAALAAGVRDAEVVVHLGALVSYQPRDRAAMFRINAEATAALASAARLAGVRRFLHVSSIAAIAYRDRPEVLDETASYNFGPLRLGYHDSKHAAERAVLAEVARGLDAVIVNPPSMYGAGDRRKGDGSLLTAVLEGRLPANPPGGLNVADVAHVVDGMLAALQRGRAGERYILGGENLTGRELLARVAAVVGTTPPRWTLPGWLCRAAARWVALHERWGRRDGPLTSELLRLTPRYLWFCSGKAERELGHRPQPVTSGIAAAWQELATAADFSPSA